MEWIVQKRRKKMIEGVEILSMRQNYEWALLIMPILYLIISILSIIIAAKDRRTSQFVFFGIIAFFCVILFFGFFNSNYTEYEVTINDNVSFTEFMDRYEVLDKNGDIYTIKEK